jgi:hypothetical protein
MVVLLTSNSVLDKNVSNVVLQHFLTLVTKPSFPPRIKHGVDSSGNPGLPVKTGIYALMVPDFRWDDV